MKPPAVPPTPMTKATMRMEPRIEGKPDEAPPPDAKAEDAPPAGAGEIQSGVKMKDLLAEGFLGIRTTVLVPADAVTRQLGKVSPDAIILTLQKETAAAVCCTTRSRLM